MKKGIIIVLFLFISFSGWTQKIIEEKIEASGIEAVSLNFPYAKEVKVTTASTDQISVYVSALIDDGENNETYTLTVENLNGLLSIGTDKEKLEAFWKGLNKKCFSSDIYVEVSMPAHLEVDFSSISGSITMDLFQNKMNLKTISGDIDISFPNNSGAEIKASTISGEMYTDLDLEFLDNKSGLNQVVGQKAHARVNNGGPRFELETISGNIFLRSK